MKFELFFKIAITILGLFFYLLFFYMSMDTAFDREAYIRIAAGVHASRIEPGMPLVTSWIRALWTEPLLVLMLNQGFVFLLFCISFFHVFRNDVSKSILLLSLLLSVFALLLGVQLRIGMGLAILCFIHFVLKPKILVFQVFCYLVPIFFHYALIPICVFMVIDRFWVKLTLRKFILLSILGATLISLSVSLLPSLLGLNAYYSKYFVSGYTEGERLVSYTFIFYFLLVIVDFLLYRFQSLSKLYYYEKIGFFGFLIFGCSLALQLQILQKLGIPFLFFYLVGFVNKMTFPSRDYALQLLLSLVLFCCGLTYFSKLVNLNI